MQCTVNLKRKGKRQYLGYLPGQMREYVRTFSVRSSFETRTSELQGRCVAIIERKKVKSISSLLQPISITDFLCVSL